MGIYGLTGGKGLGMVFNQDLEPNGEAKYTERNANDCECGEIEFVAVGVQRGS